MCPTERAESDSLTHDPPSHITPSDHSHFRTIHRQTSIDIDSTDSAVTVTVVRPEPQIGTVSPVSSDKAVSLSINTQLNVKFTNTLQSPDDSFPQSWSALENKHSQEIIAEKEIENITSCANTVNGTNNDASLDNLAHLENCNENNNVQTITFGESNQDLKAETELNSILLPKHQSSVDILTLRASESEEGAGLETLPTNQNADSAGVTGSHELIVQSEDPMVLESSKSADSQDRRKGTGSYVVCTVCTCE